VSLGSVKTFQTVSWVAFMVEATFAQAKKSFEDLMKKVVEV
jgi:hypothetical protein